MDIKEVTGHFSYKVAGTLYWTEDREGNIWVLLARRTFDSVLGRVYTYTIHTVELKSGEDFLEAAARASHDELGIMPDTASMERFFFASSGGIEVSLFSKQLTGKMAAKCNGMYKDALWFCLPDDCRIEDGDLLLRDELKAFRIINRSRRIA